MSLSGAVKLSHKVAVYVPSTTGINQTADTSDVANAIIKEFCSLYGGATSEKVSGYWMSDTAGLVAELPTPVWAFCTSIDEDMLERIALRVKAQLKQDAVLIEIDNVGYLV